ncbi:hypothetical protein LX36DRAFT_286828 [Colletotrichum falcatum]|nr:hypothetical protein LX36DRAFT_286828 [Colletotrichum falcatum]
MRPPPCLLLRSLVLSCVLCGLSTAAAAAAARPPAVVCSCARVRLPLGTVRVVDTWCKRGGGGGGGGGRGPTPLSPRFPTSGYRVACRESHRFLWEAARGGQKVLPVCRPSRSCRHIVPEIAPPNLTSRRDSGPPPPSLTLFATSLAQPKGIGWGAAHGSSRVRQ